MPDILTPIRVSELPEVTEVNDSDYLIIDNGTQTSRITSEHFNENASASAHHYADEAARSALSAEQYAGVASGSADTAAAKAQESNASAQDSEAWAVGKRAGQDVPSTDDAYHNNARYFAGQAHTSATEAANSADTATEKAAEISAAAAQIEENTDDIALLKGDFASVESGMTATRAYVIGDLIIAEGQLYRAIAKISNGATLTPNTNVVATSVDAEVKRIDAEKADKGGNYPDLTAGNANQLVSDSYVSDNAPYMMRPSAGGAEIGNREIDELVGGTVAWNQLAGNGATPGTTERNGVTFTVNSDGSVDVSGTATANTNFNLGSAVSGHANHKRLIIGCPAGGSGYTYSLRDGYGSVRDTGSGAIDVVSLDLSIAQISIANGYAISGTLKFKPLIFDLTQMFGSTIADYLYALEIAHAGDGVAWFRRLFSADYYAYDAGSLKSVEGVSAHVTIGFNQWDEQWEQGLISISNGQNVSGNGIRSKNYTPCLPDTDYYGRFGSGTTRYIFWYDANKNYISYRGSTALDISHSPSNASFFRVRTDGLTSYNHDICINLSDPDRNGEYEPYTAHTYPLDSTIKLQGIFKLDSANRLYADGDIYPSDGQVQRRYRLFDFTDSSQWASSTTVWGETSYGLKYLDIHFATLAQYSKPSSQAISPSRTWRDNNGQSVSGAFRVYNSALTVYDDRFTDKETAISLLQTEGFKCVYLLINPTTETADPFTNPQIVDNLGTEQYVTTGIVPVGHETKYLADLKSKLEVAPDSPDTDGDYIMRRTSGENAYTPLASAPAITNLNERKADIDGDYPNMVVGNAEQLVATVGIEDETPYLFRTSGGSIDIGDREEDMLVGGTIAWNQLVQNGNFADASGWAVIAANHETLEIANQIATITVINQNSAIGIATPCAATKLENHKILFSAFINPSADNRVRFGGPSAGAGNYNLTAETCQANVWTHLQRIGSVASGNTTSRLNVYVNTDNGLAVGATVQVKNVNAFDLTQMFGFAIADYIYNIESAHAGDGVAWFRKLFPVDFYPFDAGTLMSVENVSAHRMIGFNQWDEEWELGSIDNNTGGNTAASTYIRAKNYIPVVPDTVYSITRPTGKGFKIYEYDASQNFITANSVSSTGASQLYTTGSNTHYIRYICGGSASPVTTYGNDICIHLAWDGERNGEYEAYKECNYPLDASVVLRGIPKLDGNNSLYYDGDTYESDGTVTRKYGIVDLGTLTWNRSANPYSRLSDTFLFRASVATSTSPMFPKAEFVGVLAGYTWVTNYRSLSADKTAGYIYSTSIAIRDDSYTDAATFKTAMSGVYLVYELATPTTESANPYSNPQIVDDWGTEEYVTDSIVPVGHQTIYQANLRAKLEMSPDSPEGDGDYIVRQTNGENSYVPLVIPTELPTMPSENGTYVLKVTVVNGTPTLSWVTE